MLIASIIFFALAALVGLTMAYLFFNGKQVPIAIPGLHGLLAVTGLVLLIISWSQLQAGALLRPIIVFVIAALGGIFLVSYHLRGRRPVPGIIVIHGLIAVIGFILLLVATGRVTG